MASCGKNAFQGPDKSGPHERGLQLSWGEEGQGSKVKESRLLGGILERGGLYPDVQ